MSIISVLGVIRCKQEDMDLCQKGYEIQIKKRAQNVQIAEDGKVGMEDFEKILRVGYGLIKRICRKSILLNGLNIVEGNSG